MRSILGAGEVRCELEVVVVLGFFELVVGVIAEVTVELISSGSSPPRIF
jgi:hypothetical protein